MAHDINYLDLENDLDEKIKREDRFYRWIKGKSDHTLLMTLLETHDTWLRANRCSDYELADRSYANLSMIKNLILSRMGYNEEI